MNERIRELARMSGLNVDSEESFSEFAEKTRLSCFAELIIRECLSIVKSNTYGPAGEYDYSYSDENAAADDRAETIYKDITYRFGVEE